MMQPVFQPLFAQYAQVIQEMSADFTSHEFITRLAQEHQREYIEVLADYRQRQAPFRDVHSILARHLDDFVPEFIVKTEGTIDPDIFGDPCSCATWRKVN